MDELELDVIEAAIEYTHQKDNGLYRDEPKYYLALKNAVHRLEYENDGEWKRPTTNEGAT